MIGVAAVCTFFAVAEPVWPADIIPINSDNSVVGWLDDEPVEAEGLEEDALTEAPWYQNKNLDERTRTFAAFIERRTKEEMNSISPSILIEAIQTIPEPWALTAWNLLREREASIVAELIRLDDGDFTDISNPYRRWAVAELLGRDDLGEEILALIFEHAPDPGDRARAAARIVVLEECHPETLARVVASGDASRESREIAWTALIKRPLDVLGRYWALQIVAEGDGAHEREAERLLAELTTTTEAPQ